MGLHSSYKRTEIGFQGNIATVLLQDYFHRGIFKPVIGENQWSRFESRLSKNVELTLQLLDSCDVKATFFALGWIADRNPEIIRRIVSKGHEIACAGYWTRGIREMSPEQFREDLQRSRTALENAGSNRIIGFRCAYQWLRQEDIWAFDILAEEGFLYDASYRPPLLGFNSRRLQKFAQKQKTKFGEIYELPTSTFSILGFNLPIAGGSYIRLFPQRLMYSLFRLWCNKTNSPFVLYFHPWELDRRLPIITAIGKISGIQQYKYLGKMLHILPKYLTEYHFQSVSDYLGIELEYPNRISEKSVACPKFLSVNSKTSRHLPGADHLATPITIIIPCYNESASISYLEKALEELKLKGKNKYKFNFLFVDDCSIDNTAAKLKRLFMAKKDWKIICTPKNEGIAGAIKTGFLQADTEIVCTIDADCSYDPLMLLKMIPLLDDKTDIVTASPYHKNGLVFGVLRWRLLLSKTLSRIYHLLLNHKLATYTSCFRVYRRSSITKIKCFYNDYRGIVEILALADFQGKSIKEYPATLHCRIFGQSKMKVIRTIVGHLILIQQIYKLRKEYLKKHSITNK